MIARILPLLFLAASLFHPARAATFEELNGAFGIPLWTDDNLWDDDAAETAKRLGWPEESLTTTDSSYRKYPRANDLVLGTRPYSLALYGEKGTVNGISMMFANKGDAVDSATGPVDVQQIRERTRAIKDFKAAIVADKHKLESALTAVLGQPAADKFGQGTQTRESVKRWDWNGHAILMAAPRDEYAAVRVLPVAVADLQGKSRIPDAELRERLASRIEKRPNGDVILKDIPMVDQGPKLYGVPATWERVMRYMGIPADMYVLAMASDTDAGGGTSIAAIATGAKEAITRGGRQLAFESGKVNILNIKKRIGRGLPIVWQTCADQEFDKSLSVRAKERVGMSDTSTWNIHLAHVRRKIKKDGINSTYTYVHLIIGYNETTGEIAFSDSWGPGFEERWMTQEEAQAISQGGYQFINF